MKSLLRIGYKIFAYTVNKLAHVYFKLRRGNAHPSVVFGGRPLLRCSKKSKVVLGRNVRIISSLGGNPMSSGNRTRLLALDAGASIIINDNVGISNASIISSKRVVIDENTLIGADVIITDTDFHSVAPGYTFDNDRVLRAKEVRISKACFVGTRAIILKGVTLGEGVIVAAGAVVTRDVPPYHIAFGNPAKCKPLPLHWLRDSSGDPLK
jgi:acetyltransferase-like isoleucine patch superfamily enzyme